MANLVIGHNGEIPVPEDVRARQGLTPDTPVRLIEVAGGILVLPLTSEPMSHALREELQQWQSLSLDTWEAFPYEDDGP